ncbi:hypothetical protein CPAV1605_1238 [seawater metagenome]|uniref:ATP-grasp domain-containing protein n=1 Tax=seawater metagenome TaxID=1561972 RepID=A0A5E8CKA0_9ZZZZ
MKNNYDKDFFNIINEICYKSKIKIEILSSEFRVLKLIKNNKEYLVYGSDFGLNDSSSIRLVDNKYATYEILSNASIPTIDTHLFDFINSNPSKKDILFELEDLFNQYNQLILKPNKGENGNDVFKISNINEINNKIEYFINKNLTFIAQPFEKIEYEIRVICINKKAKLYYKKKVINSELGWKHNLSDNIQIDNFFTKSEFDKINSIINQVIQKIPCKNCSIDFIKTYENEYKVLEINGIPSLTEYSKISKQTRNEVENIYYDIISKLF